MFFYSFLGHKEFRFIFPVLPLAFFVCGTCLAHLSPPSSDVTAEGDRAAEVLDSGTWLRLSNRAIVMFLVLTNLPVALYTGLIHQRGTVDVTRFLYEESHYVAHYNRMSVRFFMPCHSTPYYA